VGAFSLQSSYTRKRKRKESTSGIVEELTSTPEDEGCQFLFKNHVTSESKAKGGNNRNLGISISKSIGEQGNEHFQNIVASMTLNDHMDIDTQQHSRENQSKHSSPRKKKSPFSKITTWGKISISLAIYCLSSNWYIKEDYVSNDAISIFQPFMKLYQNLDFGIENSDHTFMERSKTSGNFFLFASAQELLLHSPELASKGSKEIPLEEEGREKELNLDKSSALHFEDSHLHSIFNEMDTNLNENGVTIMEAAEEGEANGHKIFTQEKIPQEEDVEDIFENDLSIDQEILSEEQNLVEITTGDMEKEESAKIEMESQLLQAKDNSAYETEGSAIISKENKEDLGEGNELKILESTESLQNQDEESREHKQPEKANNSLLKSLGNIIHEGQGIFSKVADEIESEIDRVSEAFKSSSEAELPTHSKNNQIINSEIKVLDVEVDEKEILKESKENVTPVSSEKDRGKNEVGLEENKKKDIDKISISEGITVKKDPVIEEALHEEIIEKDLLEDSLLLDMNDFFSNGLHNHNTFNPHYGINDPANSHLHITRHSEMYDGESIVPKYYLPPLLHEGFHVDIDEISISSGDQHVCAIQYRPGIDYGGFAKCWGHNGHGQAKPPPGRFMQISSGHFSTCGITEFQTVVCWGLLQPNPVGRFIQISVGDWHGCGILEDGSIRCWGRNDQLQASPPSPYYFTKEPNDALRQRRSHSSGFHKYNMKKSQENDKSENNDSSKLIHKISNKREEFVQVSCGKEISCGLTKRGLIHCWGKSMVNPPPNYSFGPFKQISCGSFDKCCSLSMNGTAVCWGEDGLDIQPGPFIQISASREHTCGITEEHQIQCWGSILDQLAPKADLVDVEITDPEEYQEAIAVERKLQGEDALKNLEGKAMHKKEYKNKWFEISVGSHHACAVNDDSELHCWSPTTALWGSRGLSSAEDFVVA